MFCQPDGLYFQSGLTTWGPWVRYKENDNIARKSPVFTALVFFGGRGWVVAILSSAVLYACMVNARTLK